ncbi:hypothetical protein M441DRAFT_458594, partial [Trichoderma asperellum CBS 433.97]
EKNMLLSFIPSRYRYFPFNYAIDCLAADDEFSAERHLEALHLYGKALRALQELIDDEETRMTLEALCGVELLGLFEILIIKCFNGSSPSHSWTRHAAGIAKLIQFQGADRDRTEFELALISAFAGPLVCTPT